MISRTQGVWGGRPPSQSIAHDQAEGQALREACLVFTAVRRYVAAHLPVEASPFHRCLHLLHRPGCGSKGSRESRPLRQRAYGPARQPLRPCTRRDRQAARGACQEPSTSSSSNPLTLIEIPRASSCQHSHAGNSLWCLVAFSLVSRCVLSRSVRPCVRASVHASLSSL